MSAFTGFTDGIFVDNLCGGGGASEGAERATGRPVDVAINHHAEAIAMHEANHPRTRHIRKSIYAIDPLDAVEGQSGVGRLVQPGLQAFLQGEGRQAGREEHPRPRLDRRPLGRSPRAEAPAADHLA